jgi:hypothetical protein
LWRQNKIALIAFLLAAALTLFFLGRFVLFTVYWSDPAHRDQRIEGWMTPGYIAHSYHVPRPVVVDALGLETPLDKRRSVQQIADDLEIPLTQLTAQVLAAIETERRTQQ